MVERILVRDGAGELLIPWDCGRKLAANDIALAPGDGKALTSTLRVPVKPAR